MKENLEIKVFISIFFISLIICLVGYFCVPSPKISIGEGLFISIAISVFIALFITLICIIINWILLAKSFITKKLLFESDVSAARQQKELEQQKIGNNAKTKKNKLAVTGFILGVLSIFLSWIGIIPILALILSSIGLHQTKERKESGEVLAIIGLILGIIFTLIYMKTYGHI
ncbi:MAG: DUF4190 domain-containing protein [Minisyncoccales bacterium]